MPEKMIIITSKQNSSEPGKLDRIKVGKRHYRPRPRKLKVDK